MAFDIDAALADARADLVVHATKGISFAKRKRGGLSSLDDAAKVLILATVMAEKDGKPLDSFSFWMEGVKSKDNLIAVSDFKATIQKLSKAGHKPQWDVNRWGTLRITLGNVKAEKSSGASLDDLMKQYGLAK